MSTVMVWLRQMGSPFYQFERMAPVGISAASRTYAGFHRPPLCGYNLFRMLIVLLELLPRKALRTLAELGGV